MPLTRSSPSRSTGFCGSNMSVISGSFVQAPLVFPLPLPLPLPPPPPPPSTPFSIAAVQPITVTNDPASNDVCSSDRYNREPTDVPRYRLRISRHSLSPNHPVNGARV